MSFLFRLVGDERASQGHGSLIGVRLSFGVDELGEALEWGSCIETITDSTLTILVKPAANSAVGEWLMDVDTQVEGAEGIRSFKHQSPFYVLFNPWCRQDQVFMEGELRKASKKHADFNDIYFRFQIRMMWKSMCWRIQPSFGVDPIIGCVRLCGN